jgi:hypothetical protein
MGSSPVAPAFCTRRSRGACRAYGTVDGETQLLALLGENVSLDFVDVPRHARMPLLEIVGALPHEPNELTFARRARTTLAWSLSPLFRRSRGNDLELRAPGQQAADPARSCRRSHVRGLPQIGPASFALQAAGLGSGLAPLLEAPLTRGFLSPLLRNALGRALPAAARC